MTPTFPLGSEHAQAFRVVFGQAEDQPEKGLIGLGLPWLAGKREEKIFQGVQQAGKEGDLSLFSSGDLLIGHARIDFDAKDLVRQTQQMYRQILSSVEGRQLYRIWNYVPQINAETAGLENYRAFCKGRSLAFETDFGRDFQGRLPAASGVGSDGTTLDAIFVAGRAQPHHVENPEQVPAYQYPAEYGPRSPSFSRATRTATATGQWAFVSGTAAIKGHASVGVGSLTAQITCTLDNLRLVSRAAGLGEALGRGEGWTRHFKIYLRRPADLAAAQAALSEALVWPEDRVTWLKSDICRTELDIEIEATLVRPN